MIVARKSLVGLAKFRQRGPARVPLQTLSQHNSDLSGSCADSASAAYRQEVLLRLQHRPRWPCKRSGILLLPHGEARENRVQMCRVVPV